MGRTLAAALGPAVRWVASPLAFRVVVKGPGDGDLFWPRHKALTARSLVAFWRAEPLPLPRVPTVAWLRTA